MSEARSRRKKNKKKLNSSRKSVKKNFKKLNLYIIICIIIAAVAIITVVAAKTISLSKYAQTISREEARQEILGYAPDVTNPRELSNALRIADSFAVENLEKDGKKIAEEAVITVSNPDGEKSKKIPKTVSMLLVVDNDLNIVGLKPFKPTYFTPGIDFNKFFDAFKEKSAKQFITQIDGIYTGDSNSALLVKNKVKEAMSLFYIEKYGASKYDKIAKGGFIFEERGAKVEPIKAKDINGNEVNFNKLKNYKLVIIGGNPSCGGCVSDVKRIGNEIKKYNYKNVKFIVFSFSNNPDDSHKLTDSLPKGVIAIQDPDRSLAKKLKVDVSPYISLVDKNLTLYYRGPGEPTRETLSNIKDFLGG